MILWEIVDELSNIVVEEFLKLHSSPGNTLLNVHIVGFLEIGGNAFHRLLKNTHVGVSLELFHVVWVFQVVINIFSLVLEETTK